MIYLAVAYSTVAAMMQHASFVVADEGVDPNKNGQSTRSMMIFEVFFRL